MAHEPRDYPKQLSGYSNIQLIAQLRSTINSMSGSTSPHVYKEGALQIADEIEKRIK